MDHNILLSLSLGPPRLVPQIFGESPDSYTSNIVRGHTRFHLHHRWGAPKGRESYIDLYNPYIILLKPFYRLLSLYYPYIDENYKEVVGFSFGTPICLLALVLGAHKPVLNSGSSQYNMAVRGSYLGNLKRHHPT